MRKRTNESSRRNPRLTIAGREVRMLGKEKTIVLALAIQLFVAGFSSFLVVGLVSLYDPTGVDGYTIEAAVTGDAADELLAAASEHERVSTTSYDDQASAQSAFQQGSAQLIFTANWEDDRIRIVTTVPDSNVETTIIVTEARGVLQTLERQQRVDRAAFLEQTPLSPLGESDGNPYYDFTYTILVPLLVFLPIFISGSITVDSITEEIERGTLDLLRVAPVTLTEIVDGKALAAIVIAPVQALTWLLLLTVNGTPIHNIGPIVLLTTAITVIVVALAATMAFVGSDRRGAQFLYSIAVIAFFAGSSFLPGGPTNTIARLAIDSADLTSYLTIGIFVVAAVGVYGGLRGVVSQVDPNEL
ncbi:ABC transporter permease [Halorubraceae archaeon YAN]|nr:ABC transporter permease [Halorubraceae archaeon YAN]